MVAGIDRVGWGDSLPPGSVRDPVKGINRKVIEQSARCPLAFARMLTVRTLTGRHNTIMF